MADREANRARPAGRLARPGEGVDLSPQTIEAAMRAGRRMRAEAAGELLAAAGAGLARLWRRAGAALGGALHRGGRAPAGGRR